ncbi:MAG: ATP cone domain-containing protein [Methanosarcinales archaeon]
MPIVVKRRGYKEKFDEKKVYGSVYAACASAHYDEIECEKIAEEITEEIKKWVRDKEEIQSIEIRRKIESELKKRDEELLFFYEQHLPNLKKL